MKVGISAGRKASAILSRTGSLAVINFFHDFKPLAVNLTVNARRSLGFRWRISMLRRSNDLSMGRIVFGSEKDRFAKSR